MSWLDQIKTGITITTGDGQNYTPHWMIAGTKKRLGFNIAKFQFPDVPGSLVNRREPLGMEYDIEIWFQGDGSEPSKVNQNVGGVNLDYLQATLDFQDSAKDKRPWTIRHPFYGQIIVQPISLSIDNSVLNVSKINCDVIETISEDYPIAITRPTDLISMEAVGASQQLATSTAQNDVITKVPPANITAKSVNTLKGNFNKFQASVAKGINQLTADFNGYMNTFNQAYNTINNLVSDASQVLNLLQAVVNKPATFQQDIRSRLVMLQGQFTTLQTTITGSMSKLDKLLYTTLAGGSISGMCLACANLQEGDLVYASDTLDVISQILSYYNQYIADLDSMQTLNGGNVSSFIPDFNSLIALEEVVNFTIANLFAIALNGKQQRSILLEYDSNWIILTHRLYGLDNADANLITLMQQNNAGLNTMLQVPANTLVIYFI